MDDIPHVPAIRVTDDWNEGIPPLPEVRSQLHVLPVYLLFIFELGSSSFCRPNCFLTHVASVRHA